MLTTYLLKMHHTPLDAGQGGRVMEATPGFFSLGDVSWFIACSFLRNKKTALKLPGNIVHLSCFTWDFFNIAYLDLIYSIYQLRTK